MTPPAPNQCKRCRQRLIAPHETPARLGHHKLQIYDHRLWVQCVRCLDWSHAPTELQAILRAILGEAPVASCPSSLSD